MTAVRNRARITNLAEVDLSNLEVVRNEMTDAQAVGHWRRIAAIYGDHLQGCAVRVDGAAPQSCDCGWEDALK